MIGRPGYRVNRAAAQRGRWIADGRARPRRSRVVRSGAVPPQAGTFFGRGDVDRRPSMCSWSESPIGAHMGSRITSTPSRRASFAAGTKSPSPEIKTIWLTSCFKA